MTAAALDLSVIIPTHRRVSSLAEALGSILNQHLDRTRFEVIVVSNFEDTETAALLEDICREGVNAKLVVSGRLGVNSARNEGLRRATGNVILFLDDDCRLEKRDHLSRLVTLHASRPEVAMMGGGYRSAYRSSFHCRNYNAIVNGWSLSHPAHAIVHPGGNLSLKSAAIRDVETREVSTLFDETIVYGGSETSFQHEVLERGRTRAAVSVFDASFAVEHKFTGNTFNLLEKAWAQGQGKSRLKFDHHRHRDRTQRFVMNLFSNQRHLNERLRQATVGPMYAAVAQVAWLTNRLAKSRAKASARSTKKSESPISDEKRSIAE